MATNFCDQPNPGATLFDVYNDQVTATRNDVPSLPGGACNFVDLNFGANGARCGCRRFWIRSALGSPTLDSAGWCMCNHHACFHDQGPNDGPVAEPRAPRIGQENEGPRITREPLSPMVDLSHKLPLTATPMDLPSFGVEDPLSFIYNDPLALGLDSNIPQPLTQPPPGFLPDTLGWGESLQPQPQAAKLITAPSQCPMPSQATSTTSSVRAKYLRPFAGKGLHTLSGVKGSRLSPLLHPCSGFSEPVLSKQPQPTESFVLVTQDQDATVSSRPVTATQPEFRAFAFETVPREAFRNLSDVVGGHEQRLDRLETVSFTGGHDECQEKHDHTDLRITDLESKMDDVEKHITSRLADKQEDATTSSVASYSTAGTSRPTHSQELYSQLQKLQAQINSLQSSLPSHNHVWEVEVVFLPFPLKKVWQEMHQFKTEASVSSDDWTQLPMTYSTRTMRSQSPLCGNWATNKLGIEWLLPRACGDKSVADRRLRSRGLIKTISVNGPDARSVQTAMTSAFGDVWNEMQLHASDNKSDPRLLRFLGLQTTWVPLRKIHKDSRLRFLTPAEMVTPAMWDVQFLTSVMMRSSEPRLFITHPNAYLQDSEAYETGWTWQEIREMSRVYPDVGGSQEVLEADAMEEHWAWNEQFDDPPNEQSLVSLRSGRHHVATSSPSQNQPPAALSLKTASPEMGTSGQGSMLKSRHGLRPPHIRTASMPVTAEGHQSLSIIKRRVVSNGQSRRSSPSVQAISQFAVVKRRRTRSPSHHFTPGWTASPSPMPMALGDRQRVRGTTPFAYATPHSNAPLNEFRSVRGTSAAPVPMFDDNDEADELYEIEIYESDSEESFDDGESVGNSPEGVTLVRAGTWRDSQQWQLPEDAPWPGIEDQRRLSNRGNMENIDPEDADLRSEASSQPSEYPSTQRLWPDDGAGFHIHEDDEEMRDD